jgi:hypothetical protein
MIRSNSRRPDGGKGPFPRKAVALGAVALTALVASSVALAQNPAPPAAGAGVSVRAMQEQIAQIKATYLKKAREAGAEPSAADLSKAGKALEGYLYRLQMRSWPNDAPNPNANYLANEHAKKMPVATFLMGVNGKTPASPRKMVGGMASGGRTSLTDGTSRWEYIGPTRLPTPYQIYYGPPGSFTSGRINGIAYDPQVPNWVYCTGAQGGVWKSEDNGRNWRCLTNADNFPFFQHVTAVAVHPRDSNIIYAGTGDFNTGEGAGTSGGLYRSVDGGVTWGIIPSPTLGGGAPNPQFTQLARQCVSTIIVDPDNPNIITIATGRGAVAGGLWRSVDNGITWTRAALSPTANTPTGDWSGIDYTEVDPNTNQRTYFACAIGNGVYASRDQGATWTRIGNLPLAFNNPANPAGGLGLRIAASKVTNGVVYVIDASASSQDARVFRGVPQASPGTGWSWTDVTGTFPLQAGPLNNLAQASYDLHITAGATVYADPTNPGNTVLGDMVYAGAISLAVASAQDPFNADPARRNILGGPDWTDISFTLTPSARMHNDQHSFAFNPHVLNESMAGNDGGVYKISYNPFTQFWGIDAQISATLGVTQFYKADWETTGPLGGPFVEHMIGGTQDNATPQFNGTRANWANVGGGDGGGCGINVANPAIQYATSQGGTLYRTTNGWQTSGTIANGDWGDTNVVTQASSAPFIGELTTSQAKSNAGHVYFGTQFLWRYSEGAGWLSDTSNPPKRKPMGNQRLAADPFWVTAIAVSSTDYIDASGSLRATAGNVIYTGSLDGQIWMTENALRPDTTASPITWRQINAPTLPTATITSISINPNNPGDILVTQSNGRVYRCANTTSPAIRYTDQSGFAAARLPGAYISDIARDPQDPENILFVATDIGVFTTVDAGSNWQNATLALGLPIVEVTGIEAMPRPAQGGNGYLYISTYGRGMWRIQLPTIPPPQLEFRQVLRRSGSTVILDVSVLNRGGQANDVRLVEAALTPDRGTRVDAGGLPVVIGSMPQGAVRIASLNFPANTLPRGAAATLRLRMTYSGGGVTTSVRLRLP